MKRVIRIYTAPSFTEAQWSARNPLLEKGEVGYLLDVGGEVIGMKVGPGRWNDLELLGSDIYSYADAVTNPIGDATGVLQGQTTAAILNKMLSPYQPPVISSAVNNANGAFANSVIREIGQSLVGPVGITFGLTNTDKLQGATPINVIAGGVFSNEGNFAYALPISLNLAVPLNPATVMIVQINVKATHQRGDTSTISTFIRFYPKIMWGSSLLSTVNAAQFMAIANRATLVTNNFRNDYTFPGNGYSWLAIPSMLNPADLVFTDVTNVNLPANYAMDSMGTLSINNGVATYNYNMYRSSFNLINSTKLRVS